MPGPFATQGNNAQDIAPVKLAGGVAAKPAAPTNDNLAAVEAVTEVVKTVGALNTQRLETEAVSGVQEDIKAVRDALQINKHPNLAESFFSAESLKDPYIADVYGRFTEIQDAVKQGRLPHEYGIERMESVMSEAVSRRPQFADSIRKAANDTAGANISSKLFSQIMASSPQDDVQQKLQDEADRLNIDVDTYQGFLQQEFLIQQEQLVLNQRKTRGIYTANDMAKQVRLGVTTVTRDLQSDLLGMIAQGGVEDPEAVKSIIRNDMTILRNSVLADLPATTDATIINANIATLDAEETRLLAMIDDGSMVKLLQSGRELFTEQAHEDVRSQGSDVTKLFYLLGGGQAGLEAMNMYTKYKANPSAFQGMFQLEQGGALTLGLMLDQTDKAAQIMRGEAQPTNESERRLAGYLSGMRLKFDSSESATQPIKPAEVVRLVDVISNAGEEYSTLTLSDARIATAIKGFKDVHSQVINHHTSDTASMQVKYAQLKRQGIISDDQLIIRNGTIQIDNALRLEGAGASNFGTGGTTNSGELNTFVRQANQALKMGQVYKANGVFPDTVFKDSDFFLNTLKSGKVEEQPRNEQQQEVINVTINPDGSFNFGGN